MQRTSAGIILLFPSKQNLNRKTSPAETVAVPHMHSPSHALSSVLVRRPLGLKNIRRLQKVAAGGEKEDYKSFAAGLDRFERPLHTEKTVERPDFSIALKTLTVQELKNEQLQ